MLSYINKSSLVMRRATIRVTWFFKKKMKDLAILIVVPSFFKEPHQLWI
jgi:hypothetical protein